MGKADRAALLLPILFSFNILKTLNWQFLVHDGYFGVFIIHQTLKWSALLLLPILFNFNILKTLNWQFLVHDGYFGVFIIHQTLKWSALLLLPILFNFNILKTLNWQFLVHDGYFGVFIIHQTLKWSAWSLTCVHVICLHAYAHVGPWFIVSSKGPLENLHRMFWRRERPHWITYVNLPQH